MLEVSDLTVSYGDLRVLWGIGFRVGAGELVALIGPNGAGKSTTLKALAGLIPVDAGRITLDGAPLLDEPPYTRIRRGLSLVPEGRGLFPAMTVQENLELGGFAVVPPEGLRVAVERACELFPILAARRRQLAGTLSGGEQQMLAMGRALMSHPRLLLMDEPSMGLAPVLVVEQNANVSLSIADRGYVLQTGNIVLADRADALLANEELKKAYLGR